MVHDSDQCRLFVRFFDLGETVRTVALALHGVVAAWMTPQTVEDEKKLSGSANAERLSLAGAAKVRAPIGGLAPEILETLNITERYVFWQIVHVPFEGNSLFGGHLAPLLNHNQHTRGALVAKLRAEDAGALATGRHFTVIIVVVH